ncbi:hypothetical protein [Flavobacterium sp.]|uniref:hypothetical protein n=3 Tax=Flavobacterium TaxID=237 RepID=UPI0039E67B1D
MKLCGFFMLLSALVSFSQNDTLSTFDVKKVWNIEEQKYYYYEKLNLKDDTFSPTNYILIDNKVIKSKNKFEIIKDGFLVKEIIFNTNDNKKTVNIVYEKNMLYKIHCEESSLKKIEVFKDSLIMKEFFYGLNNRIYNYHHTDFGYFLFDHFNSKIYKYKVIVKKSKIVNKVLIDTINESEIAQDVKGEYFYTNDFNESSEIFDRFVNLCSKG